MDSADVECDNVLVNIFKDAFQDSYDESTELSQYLSELSSYGISKLNSEPHRLAEEKEQILKETRSLAFHNYKTFIQTADCCKEIFQDFQIIETHVESVLHKVPDLTSCCKEFLKEAQDINIGRKANNLTLLKYPQLLELLELPQLVDTCVRNEYYEETLELAEYVKRLEKKHSNIAIIQKIVEEVKVNMQLMLMQLLQQLRSNIQLPVCLRVLGYLRRMNIFTEVELRIKFLQARDAWFHSVLQAIPKDDPYQHISKTIEASRVHLFDIITQYRAIFSDDEVTFATSRNPRINEAALFHSWVLQKISQFLTTLEEDLNRGVGNRLDSLFGQCMYFGLSFSRVGSDFRALVVPIFHNAILKNFKYSIREADQKLHEMLQSFTLLGAQNIPSSVHLVNTGPSLHPPASLMEFPPLAAYCNNLLTAFNDLRICTTYALVCDVTECVSDSLASAVELIVAFHRLDETTFNDQESEKFKTMCKSFAADLMPHINRCLSHLFNPRQMSDIIGAPILEHVANAKLGELNLSEITKPISKFIQLPLNSEDFIKDDNDVKVGDDPGDSSPFKDQKYKEIGSTENEKQFEPKEDQGKEQTNQEEKDITLDSFSTHQVGANDLSQNEENQNDEEESTEGAVTFQVSEIETGNRAGSEEKDDRDQAESSGV